MGGKKRLSLRQMERMQARRRERGGRSDKPSGSATKTRATGILPPDPKSKGVVKELKRMRVLTPYTVASRLDIRLSAAKRLLRELEQWGTIEFVSGGKSLKIYKIAD